MKSKHNERRLAVLSYIRQRVEADGEAPTLAEIADACGFASRSAARKHVQALQESGELEAPSGKARGAKPKVQRKPSLPAASTLFEVSPQDISALDDTDLRELVGRLCIARLADKGFPPDFVTWGGEQREGDGGVDVRVDMPARIAPKAGFPTRLVGYQVKATKMPPQKILTEMCPGGELRRSIRDIIRGQGAYIIASSDSVADTRLQERVATIKNAAASEPESDKAHFDFCDARKLADWTNQHPGVVAWVRTRLGRALHGWRPYGQWAISQGTKEHPFVGDKLPRLTDPADPHRKYSLIEGIKHLRSMLQRAGTSIRLIGLSGVGKTRFVQALFEERAAPGALSAQLPVYCDSTDDPSPPPLALLDELLANSRHAILIVDNCSSQLHAQLAARCKAASTVSLLTIEYDIRDEILDETSVFRLEAGSPDLIEKVVKQQYPHISSVNISTIVSFSDGNSRVALALASTLDHNDSLAGISNESLFERLFWQRRQVDPRLLLAAQVCSLVYSFDGEDQSGELEKLASLAEMSALELYRHVNELTKRGLVQKRGMWRAILPHAIANRLAAQALSVLPYSVLDAKLVRGRDRLLRSFSRRLGYLHNCREAVEIVQIWFSDEGLLSDVAELATPLGEVLQNIAPTDPEATLDAIERAASGHRSSDFLSLRNASKKHFVRILRSIAWDGTYFERCLGVLVRIALEEPANSHSHSTEGVIKSMFMPYLSGTHASTGQRVGWVRWALNSSTSRVQQLGIECLNSSLEITHITAAHDFDFGARSRDYGASPESTELREWLATFISVATEIGVRDDSVGKAARDTLAMRFRALWSYAGMLQELEEAVPKLASIGWERGWLAIKQTLRFDGQKMHEDVRQRLQALERTVHPRTLVEQTKAVVLSSFVGGLDIGDAIEDADAVSAHDRADQLAKELGTKVGSDRVAFNELLPSLVENRSGRQWKFGEGLSVGSMGAPPIWDALVKAYEASTSDSRSINVLRGFMSGLYDSDRPLFEKLMDSSIAPGPLMSWAPLLQLVGKLDERGCERLARSIANPDVPIEIFHSVGHGRVTSELSGETLSRLLDRLARRPGGVEAAIDVLSMHVYDMQEPYDPALTELARDLLSRFAPAHSGPHLDHSIKMLISKFLGGPEGAPYARAILRRIRKGFENYTLSPYDIDEALTALFNVQPLLALDELVGDESDEDADDARKHGLRADHARNPLGEVPVSILTEWCSRGGLHRWQFVANSIPAFDRDEEEQGLRWSEAALTLVRNAPDPLKVAAVLAGRIEPMSWSGSRASAIESRLPLLDELAEALGESATSQVDHWRTQMRRLLERERRRELDEHRQRNLSFE